ncbi:MAG: DUF6577 family protein [Bacilli bacterium]
MTIEERLLLLKDKPSINRDELYQLIRQQHPNYKDASLRWVIYGLVKKGLVSKINHNQYLIGRANIFRQKNSSDQRNRIVDYLNKKYPNIRIAVYESTLLNEWVNHQIARNLIFVETEKYFMNDVFRSIYEKFAGKAILNPNKEDLNMYNDELVIVKPLASQAPINQKTREIKIEKLIVDLYTKDLINEFISEDEKEDVIQDIFKKYLVNQKTIFAYAKRRNNTDLLKKILSSYELGSSS